MDVIYFTDKTASITMKETSGKLKRSKSGVTLSEAALAIELFKMIGCFESTESTK